MEQQIFTNEQVDLSALPTVEGIEFVGLEKKYRKLQYLIASIITSVLLLGFILTAWLTHIPLWVSAIVVSFILFLGLLQFLFITKGFKFKGYAVRSRDFVYQKGWLYKKQITVPYSRVQHVDIKQGVLDIKFGLSQLNVYTAGGQSSDLTIPGLKLEDAKQFKSFILKAMGTDEEE